jgi:succinyl-CoA synthetase alpha subunit
MSVCLPTELLPTELGWAHFLTKEVEAEAAVVDTVPAEAEAAAAVADIVPAAETVQAVEDTVQAAEVVVGPDTEEVPVPQPSQLPTGWSPLVFSSL